MPDNWSGPAQGTTEPRLPGGIGGRHERGYSLVQLPKQGSNTLGSRVRPRVWMWAFTGDERQGLPPVRCEPGPHDVRRTSEAHRLEVAEERDHRGTPRSGRTVNDTVAVLDLGLPTTLTELARHTSMLLGVSRFRGLRLALRTDRCPLHEGAIPDRKRCRMQRRETVEHCGTQRTVRSTPLLMSLPIDVGVDGHGVTAPTRGTPSSALS